MKDYLAQRGTDVLEMWTNEYDENLAREVLREKAWEDGCAAGEARGVAQAAKSFVTNMLKRQTAYPDIAAIANTSIENVRQIAIAEQLAY